MSRSDAFQDDEIVVWRGGAPWALGAAASLSVDGSRRETANDDAPEHRVGLTAQIR